MVSEKPLIHVLSTRLLPDGSTAYRLLVDGKYWHANQWEYDCIRNGHDPEDLGMFEFCKEEDFD